MKYVVIGLILFWYLIIQMVSTAHSQVLGSTIVSQYHTGDAFTEPYKLVYVVGSSPSAGINNSQPLNGGFIADTGSVGLGFTREIKQIKTWTDLGGGTFGYKTHFSPSRDQVCADYGGRMSGGKKTVLTSLGHADSESLFTGATYPNLLLPGVLPVNLQWDGNAEPGFTTSYGWLGSNFGVFANNVAVGHENFITTENRLYDSVLNYPKMSFCQYGMKYYTKSTWGTVHAVQVVSFVVPIFEVVNGTLIPDPIFPIDPPPAMCSGYVPSTDTFKTLITETKTKLENTPIAETVSYALSLTSSVCPTWTVPGVLGFGGFDINAQCSSVMTNYIYPVMKFTLFMAAGMASIRMSVL